MDDTDGLADLLRRYAMWAPPQLLVPKKRRAHSKSSGGFLGFAPAEDTGSSPSSATSSGTSSISRQILSSRGKDGRLHTQSVLLDCKNGHCHQRVERGTGARSMEDFAKKMNPFPSDSDSFFSDDVGNRARDLDGLTSKFANIMKGFQQGPSRRTN